MSAIPVDMPRVLIDVEIDGEAVRVPEGATILDAWRATGVDTPTMCYADNLTPINACRVCVVEVEGARVLAPACSRKVEPDVKVRTDTDRVRTSRKLVMEFLASSVDTTLASTDWHRWQAQYEADPDRFGARMAPLEPRNSITSLREVRTRSVSVRTFMSGSTFREQAGASTRAPSTSTTQTRHALIGVRLSA